MSGQLLGVAALVAFVIWLVGRATRRRRRPGMVDRPVDAADIDRAELEAAEREVRDLGSSVSEGDGFVGDDWGPGAAGRGPKTGA